MVFPSIPVYLDPPNWNQQPSQQPGNGIGTGGSREMELAHQLPPGTVPHQEGGIGAPVRPNSMADRARQLAKLPPPELALKCPRCDSNNTKFCYFNNYSLSQPRHFCKTCRRYWTRGGALRNVPVGGGCRRNKRSKSGGSSSKSQTNSSSTSNATSAIPPSVVTSAQFPFMPSLYPLGEEYGAVPNIGLNFPGIQSSDGMDYHQVVGGGSSSGLEQWRIQQIQQFPFFGALEVQAPAPVTGLYPFDGEGSGVDGGGFLGQAHARASTSGLITQMASVKMEDSSLGLNLQRHYMGVPRNDQYWGGGVGGGGSSGGGGWMMDLSGFNSSSPGNQL